MTTIDALEATGLTDAAIRFDAGHMRALARESIAGYGVLMTWEKLIRPAWESVQAGPASAALLFERAMIEALVTVRPRRARRPAPVLLACANEERHTLGLEVLAAALAEAETSCCVLGAQVPARAVASAIDRLRPDVVALWSQTSDTADPGELLTAMTARSPATIIAAGPGWEAATVPPLTMRPTDVATAADLTLSLLAARPAGRPARRVSVTAAGRAARRSASGG